MIYYEVLYILIYQSWFFFHSYSPKSGDIFHDLVLLLHLGDSLLSAQFKIIKSLFYDYFINK